MDKGRWISVRCQVEALTGPAWSSERISFCKWKVKGVCEVHCSVFRVRMACYCSSTQGHMNLALSTPGPLVSIFWCDRSLRKRIIVFVQNPYRDLIFFRFVEVLDYKPKRNTDSVPGWGPSPSPVPLIFSVSASFLNMTAPSSLSPGHVGLLSVSLIYVTPGLCSCRKAFHLLSDVTSQSPLSGFCFNALLKVRPSRTNPCRMITPALPSLILYFLLFSPYRTLLF